MALRNDLMFLELLLGFIINHSEDGDEEVDQWLMAILVNQTEYHIWRNRKAAEICSDINPALAEAVRKGYEDLKNTNNLSESIAILEKTLTSQITKVRKMTKEDLYSRLKKDFGIAKLFAEGIHIEQ